MTKKVTELPAATDISIDDVIHVVDVAAPLSEKVSMGALGLVDNTARHRVRDDFLPAIEVGKYTDSGAAFAVHADNVADVAGEGAGVRRLETTVNSSRDIGAMLSGGITDLIVRTRFRVVSAPANIGTIRIGMIEAGGVTFGIFATRGAGGFVAVFINSVAGGGGGQETESTTTLVQNTWYEVEIRVHFVAETIDFYLDGVAESLGIVATDNTPHATEDMGLGYQLSPSSGTGIVEIDYIEVIGKRW